MPICYMVYTYLTKTVDTVCTECTILYYVSITGNMYMLDALSPIHTVSYIYIYCVCMCVWGDFIAGYPARQQSQQKRMRHERRQLRLREERAREAKFEAKYAAKYAARDAAEVAALASSKACWYAEDDAGRAKWAVRDAVEAAVLASAEACWYSKYCGHLRRAASQTAERATGAAAAEAQAEALAAAKAKAEAEALAEALAAADKKQKGCEAHSNHATPMAVASSACRSSSQYLEKNLPSGTRSRWTAMVRDAEAATKVEEARASASDV